MVGVRASLLQILGSVDIIKDSIKSIFRVDLFIFVENKNEDKET